MDRKWIHLWLESSIPELAALLKCLRAGYESDEEANGLDQKMAFFHQM
jgi:hypothetical protein